MYRLASCAAQITIRLFLAALTLWSQEDNSTNTAQQRVQQNTNSKETGKKQIATQHNPRARVKEACLPLSGLRTK